MRNESGITESHEEKLELSKDFSLELLNAFQNHIKRSGNVAMTVDEFQLTTQASIAYFLQQYLDCYLGESSFHSKTFLLKYLDKALNDKLKQ
jgi:hypothetical protein